MKNDATTTKSQSQLTDTLGQKAQGELTERKRSDPMEMTIESMIRKMDKQIKMVLPEHISSDRLIRLAITALRTMPNLKQCTVPSVLGGVMQAAQMGLEIGVLGQCWLLPFKNKGQYEATLVVGYQGLVDMMYRSQIVDKVFAEVVREHDEFSYCYGTNEHLTHRPCEGEPGKVIGAYAYAVIRGKTHFKYVPMQEINRHKAMSPSGSSSYSPWTKWPEDMYRKTALKLLAKWCPKSVEWREAPYKDNTINRYDDNKNIIENIDYNIDVTENDA